LNEFIFLAIDKKEVGNVLCYLLRNCEVSSNIPKTQLKQFSTQWNRSSL